MNTPRFVVMTARATLADASATARHYGYNYRTIAVVETDQQGMPKFIGERAKHLVRIVERSGPFNVGKTDKSAYAIGMAAAERLAEKLNAAAAEGPSPAQEAAARVLTEVSRRKDVQHLNPYDFAMALMECLTGLLVGIYDADAEHIAEHVLEWGEYAKNATKTKKIMLAH
jgi:hypothetical protein